MWWALLLALSSLARYHPAAWVAALDVDESRLAIDLERTLDEAEQRLPDMLAEALGSPNGMPRPSLNSTARWMNNSLSTGQRATPDDILTAYVLAGASATGWMQAAPRSRLRRGDAQCCSGRQSKAVPA